MSGRMQKSMKGSGTYLEHGEQRVRLALVEHEDQAPAGDIGRRAR